MSGVFGTVRRFSFKYRWVVLATWVFILGTRSVFSSRLNEVFDHAAIGTAAETGLHTTS